MDRIEEETKSIEEMFGEVIDGKALWDEYYSVGTTASIPEFQAKMIYDDFESEKVIAFYDEPLVECDSKSETIDILFRKIRAFIKYHTKTDDHSKSKLLWRVKPELHEKLDGFGKARHYGYARLHMILGE